MGSGRASRSSAESLRLRRSCTSGTSRRSTSAPWGSWGWCWCSACGGGSGRAAGDLLCHGWDLASSKSIPPAPRPALEGSEGAVPPSLGRRHQTPTANRHQPPVANRHQPPAAANCQPLFSTVTVVLSLAHALTMKLRASP